MRRSFQRVVVSLAVLLPERFRGGCAFGSGLETRSLPRESFRSLREAALGVKRERLNARAIRPNARFMAAERAGGVDGVLVTGAAGFIGFHVARALLARGERVIGLDSVDPYYDVRLKEDRLAALEGAFSFVRCDLGDDAALAKAVEGYGFERIVHLAAQAGVRYSLEAPLAYGRANLIGHLNVLELARRRGATHLLYASSSSVYGAGNNLPFRVGSDADHPLSLYAATKRADELMSESYAHLFGLPQTGVRFFTVYGPWGRPDMAVWRFTEAVLEGAADHALQSRPDETGLHLHRRCRRGGSLHARSPADRPRRGFAARDLQPRGRAFGTPPRAGRDDRAVLRSPRRDSPRGASAGRCGRHLR